jgi:hypothetical protein
MALAIQYNGGGSLGFISPALYSASIKSPDAFRDPFAHQPINVRTDSTNTQDPLGPLVFHLRLLGQLGTLHALKGYDESTGLGSPCASASLHPRCGGPNRRTRRRTGLRCADQLTVRVTNFASRAGGDRTHDRGIMRPG